jgi:putative NADPH-quinone reductase
MTRILIVNGHPDPAPSHFVYAAASAYEEGAASRHEVRRIDVGRLSFPLLRNRDAWAEEEACEDIRVAQDLLRWADHLVLVYPLWLGDVPALLKSFLEQVMRPGFALRYRDKGFPEKLLAGKSARIIVTMAMPGFAYSLFYRAHSVKSLQRNILSFVGFAPVRHTLIGMVEGNPAKRKSWLDKLRAMGARGA